MTQKITAYFYGGVVFKDAQSARLCVDIIDLVVLTTVLALVAIISNCGIP